MSLMVNKLSYLRARDPSILDGNIINWNKVVVKLQENFAEESQKVNADDDKFFKVYLRIKNVPLPRDLYDINGNEFNVYKQEGVKKTYEFTKIFGPEATQTDLFNNVLKVKMLNFINGENSSILTYGASGSGKTFTLLGTDSEPGLVPRALEYLFRSLPKNCFDFQYKPLQNGNTEVFNKDEIHFKNFALNNTKSYFEDSYRAMQKRLSTESIAILDSIEDITLGVWVTFAEIYNEAIYDLFQVDFDRNKQRNKLQLGTNGDTNYIKGLLNIPVCSGLEAYQLLQYGLQSLSYAETKLNQHSSRSHAIFTIKLLVNKKGYKPVINQFNFCDLAGSERLKKTQNKGDRLQESNNINTSLLVLGRCIKLVRDVQQQKNKKPLIIPFRESKLTRLFQRALLGMEDISMIITINPTREMFSESQHVMDFSATIKEVNYGPVPSERRFSESTDVEEQLKNEYEAKIEELKDEILELEEKLMENEHDNSESRKRICKSYEKLLAERQEAFENTLKARERILMLKHKMEIDELRKQYEKVEDDVETIDLTDEEEPFDSELYQLNQELQIKNNLLEEELEKCKRKIAQLEKFNKQYKEERDELKLELFDNFENVRECKHCLELKRENALLRSELDEVRQENFELDHLYNNSISLKDCDY